MFSAAALAFAACSNDEEGINAGVTDGTGMLAVKIVNPSSRGISNPTLGGDNITVGGGNLTVNLYTDGNTTTPARTATITADEIKNGTITVKFWNIENPTKVTVSRNGGVEDYSAVQINATTPAMQAEPTLIPVFGVANSDDITLTADNDSPVLSDDDKVIDEGATDADKTKKYQMYTATINMTIPVARLEVSNLKHIVTTGENSHNTTDCRYSKLTITGVYLDNVRPTDGGTLTDYRFEDNADAGTADGEGAASVSPLKDAVPSENSDFLAENAVWPAAVDNQAKAYAYNFYTEGKAVTDNPIFKVYFKEAVAADGQDPVSQPRFAVIKKYVDAEGEDVIMQKGHIYRITDAQLDDDNITGDESGKTLYGVTVTVVEAAWTPVDINAVWEE